jgi:hypothetical protein
MILAVMQPTYLPWPGYFNLIRRSDEFVFLDDVQFSAQSWQQRNRVMVNGQPHVLTVPVLTKGRGEQRICDVATDENTHWRKKHISTLQQAYAKHPHGKEVVALIEEVVHRDNASLAQINMDLIRSFCTAMEMNPVFHVSSQLSLSGHKSARVLAICRVLGADSYLSPVGSREYIEEEGLFATSEVKVSYQNYNPASYPQRGMKEFVSHLSMVDVLANIGFEEGRRYVEQADA